MPELADLKVAVNAEVGRLEISFNPSSGARAVVLSLDAAAVDRLVEDIAFLRDSLTPPIPHDAEQARIVHGLGRPRWVASVMETGALSLALRHPGLGWIQAVFPSKDAQTIGNFLLKPRRKTNLQ